MNDEYLRIRALTALARRRLYYYCYLLAPDFYKPERQYLIDMCDKLQDFLNDDKHKVLVIDLPPRHGKSRTLQKLVEWALGSNNKRKIMTGSYNDTLSTNFAKGVRDTIMEQKGDIMKPVYSDVFPTTHIKKGDAAQNLWSLESGYNNYLATSPKSTATGFGCDILIIDDVIKNAEEAHNENVKEQHWNWFTNTMLSRLEEGGKIIIVMTRWATNDLAGRILEHYNPKDVIHINMKAVQDDGSMLCDEILSADSCNEKKRAMGADIWSANYQQEPIDVKGRLYSSFKTYDINQELPNFKQIRNYTDSADEGADYHCSICYGVTFNNEAYVLDLLYTQQPMEYTEPAQAKMLIENGVNKCVIESNNGGRGFARSVQRHLAEMGSNKCVVKTMYQAKNKEARIISNATWIMEHVYYPNDWRTRWPDYYDAMVKYQREGKNKHDDAPDATTGIAEDLSARGSGLSVLK